MSEPNIKTAPRWKLEILGLGYQTKMPAFHTIYGGTDQAKGVKFSVTESFFPGVTDFTLTLPRQPGRGHILIPPGSLMRVMIPGLEEPGLLSPITKVEEKESEQVLSGNGFVGHFERVVPSSIEPFRTRLSQFVIANSLLIWEFFSIVLQGFLNYSGDRMFSEKDPIDPPLGTPTPHPLKSITGWKHYPAYESQNVSDLLLDGVQALNRPMFDSDGEPFRPIARWRFWIDGLRRFRIEKLTEDSQNIHRLVQGRHFLDVEVKSDSDTVRNSVSVYHKASVELPPKPDGTRQFSEPKLIPSWNEPTHFPFPARDELSIEKYGEKEARLDFDYELQDDRGNSGAIQGWEIANRVIAMLRNPYEEVRLETTPENLTGWGTHDLYMRNTNRKITLWSIPDARIPRRFSVPVSQEAPGFLLADIQKQDQVGGAYSIRVIHLIKPKSNKPTSRFDYTFPDALWGSAVFHTKIYLPTTPNAQIFYIFHDSFGNIYRYPLVLFPGEWTDVRIPIRFEISSGDLYVQNGPDYYGPLYLNKPPLGIARGRFLVSDTGEMGGILDLKKISLEIRSTDKVELSISWGSLDGLFSDIKRLPLKEREIQSEEDIKIGATFGEMIDPDSYLERLKTNTRKGESLRRLFTSYGIRGRK